MGRPDFRRSTTYPASPLPHALHDDNADVVDGDVAEGLDDGLPVEHGVSPSQSQLFQWGVSREYL